MADYRVVTNGRGDWTGTARCLSFAKHYAVECMFKSLVVLIGLVWSAPVAALDTSAGKVAVTPVVTGLEQPWAVGFLPGGGLLITEREGRLL